LAEDRARGALALAVLAGAGAAYVGAALSGVAVGFAVAPELAAVAFVALALAGVVGGAVLAIVRPDARPRLILAGEVALLVVLPAWGLAINQSLPECEPCGDANRAVAWPGVLAVYALYAAGVLAYVASRRWTELPLPAEVAVQVALLLGIVTTSALSVQFGVTAPMGLVYAPIGLPLAAPPAVSVLWGATVMRRASRQVRATAIAGGAASTITVLDAILHLALTSKVGLFGGAFTATCGWTMSQMVPPDVDCHYLCTVAAQGHPWLVRPLRMGVRGGRPIVVNRQLAVANAFEDLIHERWPRAGRWLRQTYDRVGLPISRYLLHPLAADAVFVAMLPAQLGFELVLRGLDRDPEARIDRMYR
jgi:hypothetical protein